MVGRFERINGQRLLHAAYLQSGLVVIGLDLLSEDRRMLDGGVHHAGHGGIHAENGFAGDDVGEIEEGAVFADVAPLRPVLERHVLLFGNREFGGGRCEFTVAELAGARLVHDEAGFGGALFLRDTPFSGGRGDEHDTAGSADLAHLFEVTAHRVRAVGILIAVPGVADGLVNLDLRPIGIQFVGKYQGKRGAAATTHLGAIGNDGDGAVTGDSEVDVRLENGRRSTVRVGPERFGDQVHAQHKRPSRDGAAQKSATADVADVVHAISFAAW